MYVVNILVIGNTFAMYVLYGSILRYLLFTLTARGFADGMNQVSMVFRNNMINLVEALWPDRENAEVVFLSRIAMPFVGMMMVEITITVLIQSLGDYFGLIVILWIIKLFVMINVAPTVEDWNMLYKATKPPAIVVILKFGITMSLVMVNEAKAIETMAGIPNIILLIIITLVPLSSWKVYR